MNNKNLFIFIFGFLFSSCSSDSPNNNCQLLFKNKEYQTASKQCVDEYVKTKNNKLLLIAAKSAAVSKNISMMEDLANRVEGTVTAAEIYSELGKSASKANNIFKMREAFEKSATIFQTIGDNPRLADVLYNQSYAEWLVSNHRQALEKANAALLIVKDDKKREIKILNHMYSIFYGIGSNDLAKHTLELVSERVGEKRSGNKVNLTINKGLLALNQNRIGLADKWFNDALALAGDSKQRRGMRGLHLNIVHTSLELNQIEKAKRHLELAWTFAEPDGSKVEALNYYSGKLKIANCNPDLASELKELERIDGESSNNNTVNQSLKICEPKMALNFFLEALKREDRSRVWDWELYYWAGKAAEVYGNNGLAESSYIKSIEALKAMRNELGFDELKSHLMDKKRKPFNALFNLLVRRNQLTRAMTIFEETLAESFVQSFVKQGSQNETIKGLNFPIKEVSDRVELLSKFVKTLRSSAIFDKITFPKIIDSLKGVEIIAYYFTKEYNKLWIIKISNGELSMHSVDVNSASMAKLISTHRHNPDDLTVLKNLGNTFFPKELLPETQTQIYLIPDPTLGEIAFSSLIVDKKFFIEQYSFSLIPSINAFYRIRENGISEQKLNSQKLVIGDPSNNLPEAREEAISVAKILDVKPILGEHANLSALLKANESDVIHIASHAGFNHLGAWLTLAEGDVFANTIINLKTQAKLTVLASCLSGTRGNNSLWGSLGGLFLASGSQSVVASLWSIEDKATRQLVEKFYSEFKQYNNTAKSLARAQRKAISNGESPKNWSGFIVMGYSS